MKTKVVILIKSPDHVVPTADALIEAFEEAGDIDWKVRIVSFKKVK